MSLTGAELDTRIANTKAMLDLLDAAILALADPTVREYTLDTGQGVQTVRRTDLPKTIASRDALLDSYATLCNRKTGEGVTHVLPAW